LAVLVGRVTESLFPVDTDKELATIIVGLYYKIIKLTNNQTSFNTTRLKTFPS
jgi:hypothetical protein